MNAEIKLEIGDNERYVGIYDQYGRFVFENFDSHKKENPEAEIVIGFSAGDCGILFDKNYREYNFGKIKNITLEQVKIETKKAYRKYMEIETN